MPEAKLGDRTLNGLRGLRLRSYFRSKAKRRWDVDFTIDVVRIIRNWPSVLLENRSRKSKPYVYYLRNGVRYHVRPGTADRDVVLEIWSDRCYNPKGFEISPEDTVVDIGAHIGVFSVFASKLAKNGLVYSVEPVPDNFDLLRRNVAANAATNVVTINKAVSDKCGSTELFLSRGNTGGHSLFRDFSGEFSQSSIRVATMTMSDLLADERISTVDFLKLDCEGGEYAMLYSCPDSVLDAIRRISMEYHDLDADRNNGKALKSWLESKGFKVEIRSDEWKMLYAARTLGTPES